MNFSINLIRERFNEGLTHSAAVNMKEIFGGCNINVPLKSIPSLLVSEVLNPFYLF
jgi:hypothetical protein